MSSSLARLKKRHQPKPYMSIRDFERKYAKEIEERQERIDDRFVMAFVICIGLAILDVYPDKKHRPSIMKIIKAFNKEITRIGTTDSFESLRDELKTRTATKTKEGIELEFTEGDPLHI